MGFCKSPEDLFKGGHTATPDGLAMLITALSMNKFIETTNASTEIKTMMKNSVVKPLPDGSFMADSFIEAGIASKVEYCKDGAGPDPPGLISEVDRYTKLPSGKRYAPVILQIKVPGFNKADRRD